ncbi:MAG: hypothetical protein ACI8Y4_002969 [Candidatus Poriferisodalaceae bacterium]|jgi:hypothetical protein
MQYTSRFLVDWASPELQVSGCLDVRGALEALDREKPPDGMPFRVWRDSGTSGSGRMLQAAGKMADGRARLDPKFSSLGL